jgi:hypothetical protein
VEELLLLVSDGFKQIEDRDLRVTKVWIPNPFREWLLRQGHIIQGKLWGADLRTIQRVRAITVEAEGVRAQKRRRGWTVTLSVVRAP